MHRPLRESLMMGVTYAVVGLSVASLLTLSWDAGDNLGFITVTTIVSLLVGGATWWWLVAGRERAGYLQGLLAGVIAVLSVQILICILLAISGDFGDFPRTIIGALLGGLRFGVMSFAVVGWITLPLGLLLGSIGIALRQRSQSAQSGTVDL